MKLKANQRGAIDMLLVAAVVIVLIVGGFIIVRISESDTKESKDANKKMSSTEVTNFDECVAAGNPVMESLPEQCSADGETFVNDAFDNGSKDDTATFTSEVNNFSLDHPSDWSVYDKTNELCGTGRDGVSCSEFVEIVSPGTNRLAIRIVEHTGQLEERTSCGTQSICYEEEIIDLKPVGEGALGDTYIVSYTSTPPSTIEGSALPPPVYIELYSPLNAENLPSVGDSNLDNEQFGFGVPIEDSYFSVFVASYTEDGSLSDTFTSMTAEEYLADPTVLEALGVLASYRTLGSN